MTRAISHALQGVILAVGAPVGWLAIQALRGTPVYAALVRDPVLYLYLFTGTAAAFGLFGFLLGEHESRLMGMNQQLEELAVTDHLSGLRNARYFHARLREEWAESQRSGRPLAVVVIDVDHFKQVNDRFGERPTVDP